MAYLDYETSVDNSQPVEVYSFTEGLNSWNYTSYGENVTLDSITYTSESIKRSARQIDNVDAKNKVEIIVPITNDFAEQYMANSIEGLITCIIKRYQSADSITLFSGRVINVSFAKSQATIRCDPLTSSFSRIQLFRSYQIQCSHILYDGGCRVDKNSYKATGTVTSISGLDVVSSTFGLQADNYYRAGYILYNNVARTIMAHTGNTVTLSSSIPGFVAGSSFFVFAGCDHASTTCLNKFSNIANYGGFPYFPVDNPFNKSILN